MALFGNENKKTIEELESYYANKTQRTGMAWAMAFLSLLITVAVLAGLFFGGRWLYREFVGSGQDTALTDPSGQNDEEATNEDTDTGFGDIGLSLIDEGDGSEGVVSDEAAQTSDPNNDRITATTNPNSPDAARTGTDSTAVAGASTTNSDEEASSATPTELPDTGAESALIMIPTAVFVMAYLYSRTTHMRG